ncbi:hypothetical protein CW713_08740 [Methanophagales archaeon]|nr:MAG: hypothetical protein CW713_08740 [Methanophagales archaeon]
MGVSVVIRGEGDMKRSVYDPNKDGEIALTALDSILQKYIEFRTWNLSYFEYLTDFDVSTRDDYPRDLIFKPDGTKMYIAGYQNKKVYEYDLSTAWDISTASFNQDFAVGSQDGTPSGVCFNRDGTKMYIAGNDNNKVYEYDLSTAWDISTASFNQDFAVNSQDGTPLGICFNPDGTKMYVAGSQNDKVYEYNLSTAWDISTASFNQDFAVGSQDNNPRGVCFNPDGTKMYVTGAQNDKVYEYVTNIDGDMKRAVYDSNKDERITEPTEKKTTVVVSDDLIGSDDAEESTGSTSYVKLKELTLNIGEDITDRTNVTLRIKFDMKASDAGKGAWGYVARDGSQVGTTRTNTTTSYVTYSEDIGNWNDGEKIQLYAKMYNDGYTTYVRNFKVYASVTTTNKDETLEAT